MAARARKPTAGKRHLPLGVKSAAWEDPDSDASDDEERRENREAKLESEHAKWGDKADDDSDADLRGSDSEDGVAEDHCAGALSGLLDRRKLTQSAPESESLWDPLAGLAPRKKRKAAVDVASAVTRFDLSDGVGAGFPLGTTVVLHGLTKAPQLNGKTGRVESKLDGATGRCSVLVEGTVKSMRVENLREVMTGAVVRLKDLQTAELNGRIGECRELDLATGRYEVLLASPDGPPVAKRIKESNLQLMRRFTTIQQQLSEQRSPFCWRDVYEQLEQQGRGSWASQLELLKKLRLPAPRLMPAQALRQFADDVAKDPKAARRALVEAAVLAEKAPVNLDGRLACRLFAVSTERDCCQPESLREDELRRLGEVCRQLEVGEPLFLLLPSLLVKPLPCLRGAAACGWPVYLQLCHSIICIDTQHSQAKFWCRFDRLLTAKKLQHPVYLLRGSASVAPSGWLLTDKTEKTTVDKLCFAQVLGEEKELAKKLAAELLPGAWDSSQELTAYVL